MGSKHRRLFLPGPTEVPTHVREALAEPVVGHRSYEYEEVHERVIQRLRKLLHTDQHVFLSSSSGTGVMEAGVRNLIGDDETVLSCICGSWSERWNEITRDSGKSSERLEVEAGEPHLPELIHDQLNQQSYAAVQVIHCETATGVINSIDEIGEMLATEHPDVLYLVDAVSTMGGTELRVDDWNIDFTLASVQKCLAVPPGLSIFAASDRAMEKASTVSDRGYYFDFERFKKYNDQHQLITTGALPQVFGLDRQLENIMENEGPRSRYERHERLGERTREWVQENGFALLPREGYESPTITCVKNTRDIDVNLLNEKLAERGFVISNGFGELADETFRIGHMGEHRMDDLEELLSNINEVLDEC